MSGARPRRRAGRRRPGRAADHAGPGRRGGRRRPGGRVLGWRRDAAARPIPPPRWARPGGRLGARRLVGDRGRCVDEAGGRLAGGVRGDGRPAVARALRPRLLGGSSAGDDVRANLGASPGDAYEPEPYLYVGPWGPERPGDPGYWNAPFGAVLRRGELAGLRGTTTAQGVAWSPGRATRACARLAAGATAASVCAGPGAGWPGPGRAALAGTSGASVGGGPVGGAGDDLGPAAGRARRPRPWPRRRPRPT